MGVHTEDVRTSNIRMACQTAAWSSSLACMIIGTLTHAPVWRAWGIWFAMVSVCLTGWGIVEYVSRRQRLHLEDLARIMAAEASDYYRSEPSLTRIH